MVWKMNLWLQISGGYIWQECGGMMKTQFFVGNVFFLNGAMEYQVVRFSMFYVVTFVDCVQQPRCLSRSLIIQDRRTFQTDLSKPPRKIPRISPHLETHRIEKKPFTHPYQQQHTRTKLQHTPGTYPWNSTTRFIKSFHVIIYVFWCTLGYVQRVCWNLLRHPQPTTTTEHDQETFLSFSTSIGATCTLALAWAFCRSPGIYDKNSSERSGKTWDDLKISDLLWVWHSNTHKTKQKTSWFAEKTSTHAGDHSTYCFFNHGLFLMFNPKCIMHHIRISNKKWESKHAPCLTRNQKMPTHATVEWLPRATLSRDDILLWYLRLPHPGCHRGKWLGLARNLRA